MQKGVLAERSAQSIPDTLVGLGDRNCGVLQDALSDSLFSRIFLRSSPRFASK